jgi:hypothetical protein
LILSGIQYLTFAKIFLKSKFGYFHFPFATLKPINLKLGLQIGGKLLIATHLDPAMEILDDVQESIPVNSLENCCDPEKIHTFQSSGEGWNSLIITVKEYFLTSRCL